MLIISPIAYTPGDRPRQPQAADPAESVRLLRRRLPAGDHRSGSIRARCTRSRSCCSPSCRSSPGSWFFVSREASDRRLCLSRAIKLDGSGRCTRSSPRALRTSRTPSGCRRQKSRYSRFWAARDVDLRGRARAPVGHHRPERRGQVHAPQADHPEHRADGGDGHRPGAGAGTHRDRAAASIPSSRARRTSASVSDFLQGLAPRR